MLVHLRPLAQPPLSVRHTSTHCGNFSESEDPDSENLLFSQQVLNWLHHPLMKYEMLLHFGSSMQDFLHASFVG